MFPLAISSDLAAFANGGDQSACAGRKTHQAINATTARKRTEQGNETQPADPIPPGLGSPIRKGKANHSQAEIKANEAIKATLVASASGMPPTLAVEFGRKVLFSTERPSFAELEQHVKQKKA